MMISGEICKNCPEASLTPLYTFGINQPKIVSIYCQKFNFSIGVDTIIKLEYKRWIVGSLHVGIDPTECPFCLEHILAVPQ